MRIASIGLATLLSSVGCMSEYHPEYHPQSSYSVRQTVSYPTTIFQVGGGPMVTSNSPAEAQPAGGDPSHVLVLESTHLDRPAEVVGVVDMHVPMGSHDSSLALLRRRAAELGADAVVGVEFHHGEGDGQPTHLSGLAVRFLRAVPYPVDE